MSVKCSNANKNAEMNERHKKLETKSNIRSQRHYQLYKVRGNTSKMVRPYRSFVMKEQSLHMKGTFCFRMKVLEGEEGKQEHWSKSCKKCFMIISFQLSLGNLSWEQFNFCLCGISFVLYSFPFKGLPILLGCISYLQ